MCVRATGGSVLENNGFWVTGLAVVHRKFLGSTFVTAAASVASVSTVTTLKIVLNFMLVAI